MFYYLVWASDEEKTGLELLQEDNTLATVDTGEKDQDGAGRD